MGALSIERFKLMAQEMRGVLRDQGYIVKIKHLRRYPNPGGFNRASRFIYETRHQANVRGLGVPDAFGGATEVIVLDGKSIKLAVQAHCRSNEAYVPSLGAVIALGRAVKALTTKARVR